MTIGKTTAKAMAMTDAVWARHANPWSGWTRLTVLPLLALAIWSRDWIGWWSVLPIATTLAWTWINPRAFPPPASTNNWMSKGVLGERVWLNRNALPIPDHHARMARLLAALSAIGLVPLVWGLWALDPAATLFGIALTAIGKLWFIDRMVWLYDDMKDRDPEYASWLY